MLEWIAIGFVTKSKLGRWCLRSTGVLAGRASVTCRCGTDAGSLWRVGQRNRGHRSSACSQFPVGRIAPVHLRITWGTEGWHLRHLWRTALRFSARKTFWSPFDWNIAATTKTGKIRKCEVDCVIWQLPIQKENINTSGMSLQFAKTKKYHKNKNNHQHKNPKKFQNDFLNS